MLSFSLEFLLNFVSNLHRGWGTFSNLLGSDYWKLYFASQKVENNIFSHVSPVTTPHIFLSSHAELSPRFLSPPRGKGKLLASPYDTWIFRNLHPLSTEVRKFLSSSLCLYIAFYLMYFPNERKKKNYVLTSSLMWIRFQLISYQLLKLVSAIFYQNFISH